jgi:hypothetical protein
LEKFFIAKREEVDWCLADFEKTFIYFDREAFRFIVEKNWAGERMLTPYK